MANVLIIAHGQPSDPKPLAQELEALTQAIAAHLPDHHLRATTLAQEGALPHAIDGLSGGLVFPMFMAAGWFTQSAIPQRLAALGAGDWQMLPSFGEYPEVQDLAVQIALTAGAGGVLLAAHGSFKSDAPAAVARKVADLIAQRRPSCRVEAAFIDQAPRLAEAYGFDEKAVCLPYFAMAGGHVLQDLPQALQEAGFKGRLLPPLGGDPRVPKVIAQLIKAQI